MRSFKNKLFDAADKPSTKFPPERLVELVDSIKYSDYVKYILVAYNGHEKFGFYKKPKYYISIGKRSNYVKSPLNSNIYRSSFEGSLI